MEPSSGYTQFTYQMRIWLSILLKLGKNYREIGRILKMHHTSISREIEKNGFKHYNARMYHPLIADLNAQERKKEARNGKIRAGTRLEKLITRLIKDYWSPDAIAGWLKRSDSMYTVSHETIYRYIYTHRRDLIPYLARRHRRRQWRGGKYKCRKKVIISGRTFIEERPKAVEKRREFGHYEADTIVSRESKPALLVVIERKSRKIRLKKLKRKTAALVAEGMSELLGYYQESVKTITYDNGTENSFHQRINKKLKCKSYFCNPYHSWEKGSVENAAGLVRRYFPKKTDFAKVTEKQLKRVENLINNRPRKLLKYETPQEVFRREWCSLV
jgi:transposase, IS30 family